MREDEERLRRGSQRDRQFGFDLIKKLLDPCVTGTAVEGQKDQRSAPNTSIPPLQHSPPRYPQARSRTLR
jgi:hypothetical protein